MKGAPVISDQLNTLYRRGRGANLHCCQSPLPLPPACHLAIAVG
jgi:hypothetical protein